MKKTLVMIAMLLFAGTSLHASYKEALKLFEEKDYKASLKMIADELETANDTKPDSPNYSLRFLAAHNHWKLGNTRSATDHFTRCMTINKKKADPYIDLALLQVEMKKYAEAEPLLLSGYEGMKQREERRPPRSFLKEALQRLVDPGDGGDQTGIRGKRRQGDPAHRRGPTAQGPTFRGARQRGDGLVMGSSTTGRRVQEPGLG